MIEEIDRIRDAYQRRERPELERRYSYFQAGHLFTIQQLERRLLELLKRLGLTDLQEIRALDVGCGSGSWLLNLARYGARPQNLCGLDLRPEVVAAGHATSPTVAFLIGDAGHLPFANATFDLVTQFTVFTSILDDAMRRLVAQEMLRVLRPRGHILWYDFILNPTNPDVRGIGLREIKALFPGCRYAWRRVTLAPPLARRLAPRSWLACHVLEMLPWLRTHYLVAITKATP